MNLGSILVHAERGRKKNPQLAMHIDGAVRLIRDGHIRRDETGDFIVDSESQKGLTYHVNGECQCPSYTGVHPKSGAKLTTVAPDGWCKHRLAMVLLIKDESYHNSLALEIDEAKRKVEQKREARDITQRNLDDAQAELNTLLEQRLDEMATGN